MTEVGVFLEQLLKMMGRWQLYFTGVNYLVENPENINHCVDEQFVSAQLMITSENGFNFGNIGDKKTVLPVIHEQKPVMQDIPEIRRSGKMATDGI